MKSLYLNARYPVIEQELLYGSLCIKRCDVDNVITRPILCMILEYVANSEYVSDDCECMLDRCHVCVYQYTDAVGGPYRFPYHKGCRMCVKATYEYK